ncbi:macro domain-containing protein [Streptomyces sp. NPDC005931]|uniref:macro domain-containing protein n=1 Tax=Streptomyces sp. NPDC005931 TaxID=3364737 RepID=UPI0036B3EAC2
MTTYLLVGAAIMLIAGVVLQVWTLRPARAGSQYALQLPVVLLYALSGASLLFTLFPDSVSEGRAIGFRLGGAAGFVGFFVVCSFVWLAKTRRIDALAKKVAELEKESKDMSRRLVVASKGETEDVQPVAHERVLRQLCEAKKFRVGFMAGGLSDVNGIDVWVNSENTRMEMSRITEPTVSATIRYLGSVKDEVGQVVRDLVADELNDLMRDATHVPAGHVFTTTAGCIEYSNGAKRVLHVATVEGEAGQGYRPVRDIGNCVRSVLSEIDRLNRSGEELRSVVIPLFGTGGGNSDLSRTALVMIKSCVDYLLNHRDSELRTIYLLAHTGAHVAACEGALEAETRLVPRQG